MSIGFREYEEKDKNTLLGFVNKLEEFVKDIDPMRRVKNLPGFSDLSLDELLENVKKHHGKILFAEENGKAIGCVVGVIWEQTKKNKLEIGPHKIGEVFILYLEKSYRGKGLGKKLYQEIVKYFKENECDSVWLSVFAPNTHAHNLYKKLGFVEREIAMLKEI